nr:glycosyltransferase [Chthoniobacterales bacterium]
GYNFGLPAVVTDVGSLADDVVEGKTGFVCKPKDASDLSEAIKRYFSSPLFHDLDRQRTLIKQFANERYSWSKVAAITSSAYAELVG